MSLNLVVLVSGRGTNLQAILDAQVSRTIQSKVSLVISNKKDALALERAAKANVPTQVVPSKDKTSEEFFAELLTVVQNAKPDLIVLAGFMKILPPSFVQAFEGKIINIHPSLLPKFPGLNAQNQALEAGETETGCTVHYVDEGCDTGPIILQKTESILPNDTEDSLSQRLLKKEHVCLIEALQKLESFS